VEYARNFCISLARQFDVDWLIQCDNDNFWHGNLFDVLATADPEKHAVWGLTSGIMAYGLEGSHYELFPNLTKIQSKPEGKFLEKPCVGGGVLAIHKTVWQKLPKGPWFVREHGDNELLEPNDKTGCSEDVYFSRLVRKHGMRVWTCTHFLSGHYHTDDATAVTLTLEQLNHRALQLEKDVRQIVSDGAQFPLSPSGEWVTQP
jgi:hypothetical protein